MYVDADKAPDDICAQVVLLNNIKSKIFDAIHVIVQ